MKSTKTSPSRKLVDLGNRLVYLSPPASDVLPQLQEPTLIIIFGWMDASEALVLKYAQAYNKRFPAATQLIIYAPDDSCWVKDAVAEARVAPAVEFLLRMGISRTNNHRILVHCLSTGGCLQLGTLIRTIKSRLLQQERPFPALPARLSVFDSSPSNPSFRTAFISAMAGVVITLAKFRRSPNLGLLLVILRWLRSIFTLRPVFRRLWQTLTDEECVPRNTARLYFYSKADSTVPFRGIERHIDMIKKWAPEGIVRAEEFIGTQHLGHMKKDPQRYWDAVWQMWSEAARLDTRSARL